MARKKARLTGCGKIFIVLIILAPLAYLGASYYNGEDPIANIKNLLGIEADDSKPESNTKKIDSNKSGDLSQQLEDANEKIEELEGKLDNCEKANTHLRQQLDARSN